MKTIELRRRNGASKYTLVDDEDYKRLNQWQWHYHPRGYAVRSIKQGQQKILMHREICDFPMELTVDHINGNKLDNRRHNLRTCTYGENAQNRGITSANKSGYKGIFWEKSHQKWLASIQVRGKTHFLGYFTDIREAAKAYNHAVTLYHPFGVVNNLN